MNSQTLKDKASKFIKHAVDYIGPLVNSLREKLDKRLTYTVFDSFIGMLQFRDRTNSLLLSELGAYVNGPEHAPAGTKRIINLLRDKNWAHKDVQDFLLEKTKEKLNEEGKEGDSSKIKNRFMLIKNHIFQKKYQINIKSCLQN